MCAISAALIPLLVLSAASGCAALIYELVWFQTLELFTGSSAVSVATLLAAFMSGLARSPELVTHLLSAMR